MTAYQHVDPPNPKDRASAPYNFVPLPRAVLLAADCVEGEPWLHHDEFLPNTHSGWFDVVIETCTPLMIGVTTRERPVRVHPRRRPDGTPVIPGSSLRGMLRTLVEILAFSKIQPVSNARPFFRSFAGVGNPLHNAYANRLGAGGDGPAGGFVRHTNDGWVIERARTFRIAHDRLPGGLPEYTHSPRYTPPQRLQHKPCWFRVDNHDVIECRLDDPAQETGDQGDAAADEVEAADGRAAWETGVLVLTGAPPPPRDGQGPEKRSEYVLQRLTPTVTVEVPDPVIERFHADDQISEWQKRAFPVSGSPPRRPEAGHLRDGEPVFYIEDDAGVAEFLGRPRYFRYPYDLSMRDLVPNELSSAGPDIAEVLFGSIGAKRGDNAIRSRVRIEDAVATVGGPPWTVEPPVSVVLSSPKPTTYVHYLVQNGKGESRERATYLKGTQTTIRGHKLYWHRWLQNQQPDKLAGESGTKKVTSELHPIRDKVVLTGRIRFDNLADIELGALLAALRLPERCRHRLGGGKPIGFGTVAIRARLHLLDRGSRYKSWPGDGSLPEQQCVEIEASCRAVFEHTIIDHAECSGEAHVNEADGLESIARLSALYTILTWDGRPDPDTTRPLRLSEFKAQTVLPGPHAVAGLPVPDWPGKSPAPAPAEDLVEQPRPTPQIAASESDASTPGSPSVPITSAAAADRPGQPSTQGPPWPKGTRLDATVLAEPTLKGRMRFQLPDEQTGHNEGDPRPHLQVGDHVTVEIVQRGQPGKSFSVRVIHPEPQ